MGDHTRDYIPLEPPYQEDGTILCSAIEYEEWKPEIFLNPNKENAVTTMEDDGFLFTLAVVSNNGEGKHWLHLHGFHTMEKLQEAIRDLGNPNITSIAIRRNFH